MPGVKSSFPIHMTKNKIPVVSIKLKNVTKNFSVLISNVSRRSLFPGITVDLVTTPNTKMKKKIEIMSVCLCMK